MATIASDTASPSASAHDAGAILDALEGARTRTLGILDPVPADEQQRQVSELMSPLCWDLAHIGHFEELWLVRTLAGAAATDELYDDVYDAFKHPRRERVTLPILDAAGARSYVATVRERTAEVLGSIAAERLSSTSAEPLLANGFVYGMVVQHEHQHAETMLATLQLSSDVVHPLAGDAIGDAPVVDLAADVLVPGGTFEMGTSDPGWSYDNERPAHEVTLAPFRIDTTPVTNEAYQRFVADGGYDDPRNWSAPGWAWRTTAGLVAPEFWARDGHGGWVRRRFGRVEAVPAREPVQHVCWYEADAYARWSGARLPTEAEWERAAQGVDPTVANLWPDLGHANAGGEPQHRWAPNPVGDHAAGASAFGVQQLAGDVWEWTSSDFHGYPGFSSFPYREYSEVFFGPDYKVLRGGSWATHPSAVRTTFRNWDFPIRRQIFAGFRCARDA
ncbi:MAG: ergothioneine biosynthesis protein EgtB [Acidimicrobiia bacterium]